MDPMDFVLLWHCLSLTLFNFDEMLLPKITVITLVMHLVGKVITLNQLIPTHHLSDHG